MLCPTNRLIHIEGLRLLFFGTNLPFLDLRRFLETAMEYGRTYGFVLLSGNAEDR